MDSRFRGNDVGRCDSAVQREHDADSRFRRNDIERREIRVQRDATRSKDRDWKSTNATATAMEAERPGARSLAPPPALDADGRHL